MRKLNPTQRTIIQALSDGCCHSGTELGERLGVTRSAVWKQINQLIESDLPIMSVPQQGYQLKQPLILLDEHEIKAELSDLNWTTPFNLEVLTSIDSTNRYLKNAPTSSVVEICCSEVQTQGRGRFGRTWHSPFGENIYCSSRWNLNCDLVKLSGLSLVTSLAIVATLKEFNQLEQIQIKWPNDILWNDKKLCGSLIEIIAESNASAQVIIGIGLNVNSDTKNNPLPDKPWCSLYEMSTLWHNRNRIIAQLIVHLEHYLTLFIEHDLTYFLDEWQRYDYLFGKEINVYQATELLTGKACGINQLGQLILEDGAGRKHLLSSGDTSLKTI